MKNNDIRKTLKQCKKAAENGYKLAKKQYKSLNETMDASSSKIEMTLAHINSSNCYVSEATDSLVEQLANTRELLGKISYSQNEDIVDLSEKLSTFSITLFGKTMAGKSTLMETLTNGDGASIGKGAQRTTRDIRTYTWNNLEITDVPGIGAFDGEEDEEIAFAAARKANLILFLITDDAPQAAEAECLGRVIELGKPVVCVLNVKSSIREGENSKITLRNIEKAFDDERLETLKNQFMAFASLGGEIWDDIPVISVHLKSAFLSLKTENKELSKILAEASRINQLKARIIEEVETHGKYYREKNFLDIVSISTLDIYEKLLYHANENRLLSEIIKDKKSQLDLWIKKYKRDSLNQVDSFITGIEAELKLELPAFVEQHYDDEDVAKAWNELIVQKQINERTKSLSDTFIEHADDRIKELARSIEKEIQYFSKIGIDGNVNIPKMHRIFDTKKAWDWGVLVAGGGGTLISGILFFLESPWAGPVGWVALGISVIGRFGSWIFESRGKKEERAKKKLEENLVKNIAEISEALRKQLKSVVEQVFKGQLDAQSKELKRIESLIIYLADTQRDLALGLQPNLLEQSKQVLEAALKLIFGGRWYTKRIERAARIPGKLLVAQFNENSSIPVKKRRSYGN
ncbi:MAG: 50S ribosome-binding GTPase [Lachnospiraceae bacterium]|nr:50S ribosome-binding GTPase [Lachnospiraceae bacterium]